MTKLQVYRDPSMEEGLGGVLDSHTPPRRAVSFSATTKTPRADGATYRTPFQSRKNQSPGVTPKPGKSPNVKSFRQIVKTPTPSRGQRQVFSEKKTKENVQNRKSQEHRKFSKSKLKTPSQTKVSTTRADGQTTIMTTTPTSAAAFRRGMRGTIVPQAKPQQSLQETKPTRTQPTQSSTHYQPGKSRLLSKTTTLTTGAFKSLGPAQRVIPKTPNSLLRREMEVLDESDSFGSPGDESLLLSPPPGAVWNALNVTESKSVTATTSLVVLSPQAAEQVQAWSSSKKAANTSDEVETEAAKEDLMSPALPRMLSLQTPKLDKESIPTLHEDAAFQLEDDSKTMGSPPPQHLLSDNGPASSESKMIQKKGGVAMDLTGVFSTASEEPTAKEKQQLHDSTPKATPLSASVPAALMSRLNAKRRASSKETSTKHTNTQVSRPKSKPAATKPKPSRTKKSNVANRRPVKPLSKGTNNSTTINVSNAKRNTPEPISVSVALPSRQNHRIAKEKENSAVTSKPHETSHRGGMAFDISFANEKKASTVSSHRDSSKKEIVEENAIAAVPQTWADKQSESFVGWLNYTFNPDEEERQGGSTVASGLRGLLIHRRLAQVRSKATELFHSDEMRKTRLTLVKEISRGRLSIRDDRDVTADIQLRRQLVTLLLSYTTPWLRMGLEVMFDEHIEPVPMTADGPKTFVGCMRLALEAFIKKRFLSDAETLTKYTKGRCTVPSGVFETRYKAQMRTLVLSRLMTLIFFLDLAKSENVLDKVPRLFGVSSKVKSSRDVLVSICRDCLSAEGDIVKHFSRIGMSVRYTQDPVDEVNLKVANLATDLRDGVLLTRLSEIIMDVSFKSYMKTLRLPAVSRLQKKYNVNFSLDKLRSFGVVIGSDINAHHIMDGHREMVLALMWCIISHCCLTRLLQEGQIEQEIKDVVRSSRERSKFQRGLVGQRVSATPTTPTEAIRQLKGSSTEDVLKKLLLKWSQAVCSSFNLLIENFTDSFADGRAICALIHYYHPSLIRLEHILSFTKDEDTSLESRLLQERKNWKMAIHSIKELGGVPAVFPVCDSTSPPDEQSTLLCLSYLCSRLMESSKEIFATILIQACYRKYQRKVLLERKMKAARFILSSWRENRDNYFRAQKQRYTVAVRVLEGFVLSHKYTLVMLREARLERERQSRAATTIQKMFRGVLGRDVFEDMLTQHYAAIRVQSFWRGILAVWELHELYRRNEGAIILQASFRRMKAQRQRQQIQKHISVLQEFARRFVTEKVATRKHFAALAIQNAWWSYVDGQNMQFATLLVQSVWRGFSARRQYAQLQLEDCAACLIQQQWRGFIQYIRFSILIESTVLVQKMVRGFLSRKSCSLLRYQLAATRIQKVWKGFSQQVQFQIEVMDIIAVQSTARRFLALKRANERFDAVMTIQCAFRSMLARQQVVHLAHEKAAATILQTFARGVIAKAQFEEARCAATIIQLEWRLFVVKRLMKTSATKIQAFHRSHMDRRQFLLCKYAATAIQTHWRGHRTREKFDQLSFAATLIQCHWRRYWVQTDYELYVSEIDAVMVLQSYARRFLARIIVKREKEAQQREMAAILLQRIWKGFSRQVQFQLDIMDIICVQSVVRRHLCRQTYISMNYAAMTLQRAFRCAAARQQLSLRIMGRRQLVQASVIKIQALCRSRSTRRKYCSQKEATNSIQRVWRGFVARSILHDLSQAACIVQSSWRRYTIRCNYLLHLLDIRCAVMIQSAVRRYQTQVSMEKNRKAAIILQCVARVAKSKKQLSRLVEEKRHFELLSRAAVQVQRILRGGNERQMVQRQHAAATCLQSRWRCYVAQNSFLLSLLEDKSAVVIQATFRMYLSRLDFMVIKFAALAIQRCTRGWSTREDIALQHFAASDIQRIWRGYRTYPLQSIIFSIVKIQSMFRKAIARQKFEELRIICWANMCFRMRKASLIQLEFRKYLVRRQMHEAAMVIQGAFRFYSQLKRIQMVSRGMIQMQSVYRGWRERKFRDKKVAQVAQRIQRETKRALSHPELRLGNRTDRALDILQNSQSLTRIMEAVKELEASTRLSVVCCQLFTKVNAANILLHLIQSCNRSVPHMELKEHILLTLENVSRYPTLVGSFAHYKYAEVFLDNVQVFRDKDGIFCLAVSLLDRISKANPAVAEFCSSHEHLKRLKEVLRVVNRRSNRRHPKRPAQRDALKKRVSFDRDYSVHLLENLIETFSVFEQLKSPNHNQAFTF